MKRLFYLLFGLVLLPALLYAQGTLSLKDINDNLTNNYYTKTVSDSKYGTTASVALKADKTYVDSNFATTAENALKQNIADMVDYYTKTAADLLLADKADTDSVYTKTAADILLGLKADLTYVNATDEAILLDDDSQDVQIEANRVAITLKATQIDMDSAEAKINDIDIINDSQDVTIEAVRVKSDSNEVGIDAHIDNLSNPHQVTALQTSYTDTYSIAATTVQSAIDTLEAWLSAIDVTDDSQDVAINAHLINPTGAHAATAISTTSWDNVQTCLDSIETAIQGIVVGSGFALESWVNSTLETNFYTQAQTNATIEAAIAAIPDPSVNQTVTVTAGEALTAGQVVSLINESGTMKAYNNPLTVNTSPNGAESVFSSEASYGVTAVALDGTRFLTTYTDGNNACYARVGTVSGSSITWGSKSSRIDTVAVLYGVTCKVDTDKVLFAYRDATNAKGNMVILSVSGTNVSIGTVAYFASISSLNPGPYIDLCLLEPNKVALIYQKSSDGYGKAKIVTISGTTPTPYPDATTDGTEFNAGTSYISVSALSSTSAIVCYSDGGNSNFGTAQVLSISGTTITPGTEYVFKSAATTYTSVAALSATTAVITYVAGGGETIVATDLAGTPDFGTPATFEDGQYNSTAKIDSTHVIIASQVAATDYGQSIIGTVNGTGITLGTAYTYNAAESTYNSVCYLGSNKSAIAYTDVGNSSYGTAVVNQWATSNYASVSGISSGAYSSGSDAVVLISGVSDDQSDLIVGSPYFLQSDFTIGTTPISLAKYYNSSTATGEIKIGTAKSATELIIGLDYK